MDDLGKRRLAFGDRLRGLRTASGLSGKRLAEVAGWPASKVSRIENARQVASDADVRTWCEVTGAADAVATALRDELRDLRLAQARRRQQARAGEPEPDGNAAERAAASIRVFEPAAVPALVQTAEYARHALVAAAELTGESIDVERALQDRMEHQQVLYTPGRQIEITLTEAALCFRTCPPEVLGAQIDRLLALQGLPGVRFGMIPLQVRLPVLPTHGFSIADDLVLIRTMTGQIGTRQPRDLAAYRRLADVLASAAVAGPDARALLTRISTRLSTS